MDRMHHSMVRQMVEAEEELDHEAEIRQRQAPARKTSVSTACQTDKVDIWLSLWPLKIFLL